MKNRHMPSCMKTKNRGMASLDLHSGRIIRFCGNPYRTGGPRIPSSEKSNRVFAMTSSSRSRPIAAKTGAAWTLLTVGRALCAAMQIEQEADSVWLGWVGVDSTATVQDMRDRASHADHFTH